MFNNKTLLITGGTGSFGNAVLDRFLMTDIKEIRIFSRDELKQDNMRHYYQREFPEYSDKLKFYIGDVRDINSVRNAMHGVDYIFHAAALKQVPSCDRSSEDKCPWYRKCSDRSDRRGRKKSHLSFYR